MYRFLLIAFLGLSSILLLSAKLSKSSEFEKFHAMPPYSGGPANWGLGDRTGGPLSSSTCTACHSGGNFNVATSIEVIDPATSQPVSSYVPGNTYEVRFTVSGNASGYGFQAGVLNASNTSGGVFTTPSAGTQVVTLAGNSYVEHDSGPIASGVFQSNWIAPASNSGNITFYAIGLGADGNGGTTGDKVSSPVSLVISEQLPTTVDYPGTPFCANESNQLPVISGTTNGTFSSSAGLTLNSTTGEVDVVNSTPGNYVVNYTYAGGQTTANVEVLPVFSVAESAMICDNETYTFGSQTLNSSNAGLNVQVFQATNGCDSTVNLTLTVLPTSQTNEAQTICEGESLNFHGQTLTEANEGLNTVILQDGNGCDSVVNLTLSVQLIDNTVSFSDGTISAVQTGATYQWVDCDNGNSPINGEVGSTFTPANEGSYAVEITVNGCTKLSECTLIDFSSLFKLSANSGVVFPNPVSDILRIENIEQYGLIRSMSLLDAKGNIVLNVPSSASEVNVSHLESGTYFLKIIGESIVTHVTLVKK